MILEYGIQPIFKPCITCLEITLIKCLTTQPDQHNVIISYDIRTKFQQRFNELNTNEANEVDVTKGK
jgi:hypothetical protein